MGRRDNARIVASIGAGTWSCVATHSNTTRDVLVGIQRRPGHAQESDLQGKRQSRFLVTVEPNGSKILRPEREEFPNLKRGDLLRKGLFSKIF